MSSASSPICGTRSDTNLPDWPRGLKFHGLRVRLPCCPWNVTRSSLPGIGELAAESQPDLIITVDNGISSHAGVAVAREHGIEIASGPQTRPDGIRQVYFYDPDRHVVELYSNPA